MSSGPFNGFEEAGSAVLEFLRARLGFSTWLVTRTVGNEQIVLQSRDDGQGVGPGEVFRWEDTFCARMVAGRAPRIAPATSEIPEYRTAPAAEGMQVAAYVGVPIERDDGELFGTLCAFDPEPQPDSIRAELALLELCSRLLGTILQHELDLVERERRAEREQVTTVRTHGESNREVALAEFLAPGVLDPESWEQLLGWEEARCRRYGHPACVVVARLADDEVEPALATRAAQVVRDLAGENDVVAQTSLRETAVLAVECVATRADDLIREIERALDAACVRASVAGATRRPQSDLQAVWASARESAGAPSAVDP